MSGTSNTTRNSGDHTAAFDEQAEKTARIIKEHDFDKMGYDASVVSIYANAFAKGSLSSPHPISKDEAARAINTQFEKLYGKTPAEYREGQPVRLSSPSRSVQERTGEGKVTRHRRTSGKDKDRNRSR
jgi:hypothetical protein